MPKINTCLSYELTANSLDHDGEFNEFIRRLTEFLKRKLKRIEVKGKFSYEQYTCGQLHDHRNLNWKPYQRLWQYCEGAGLEPFASS